jgi:hypothetical protein
MGDTIGAAAVAAVMPHLPEIGRPCIHAGELAEFAIGHQRHGAGAAAFQPQQDR